MYNHKDQPWADSVSTISGYSSNDTTAGILLCLFPIITALVLGACSVRPLIPYSEQTPPLILAPVSEAGVQDKRERFREIFCRVLEERKNEIPDYQPCEETLTQVGVEPEGKGMGVDLGPSRRRLVAAIVPGIGWDCFETWLDVNSSAVEHVRQFGFDLTFTGPAQLDPEDEFVGLARS